MNSSERLHELIKLHFELVADRAPTVQAAATGVCERVVTAIFYQGTPGTLQRHCHTP